MENDIAELRLWLLEQFNVIGARFDKIEEGVNSLKTDIGALVFLHAPQFFEEYKKRIGLSSPEKKILLRKFEDGTITYNEALTLRKILEQEKQEAFAKGALAALAVIGLLVLLGAVIESLQRK